MKHKGTLIQPDDIDVGMNLLVHSLKHNPMIETPDGQKVPYFNCPIKGSVLNIKGIQLPFLSAEILAGPLVGTTSTVDVRDYNFMIANKKFVESAIPPIPKIADIFGAFSGFGKPKTNDEPVDKDKKENK